jgi:RNA polymerase sigma-70 factor (ECF subfamily)
MNTTSISLLQRLRQPGEQEAWARFVKLYTPMLFSWARWVGMNDSDASDLVQDILTTLVQRLPLFNYDQSKSFRGWLMTLVLNCWRDRQRRQAVRPGEFHAGTTLNPAGPDTVAELAESEYRQQLVARPAQQLEEFLVGLAPDPDAKTLAYHLLHWEACLRHTRSLRPQDTLV